uniref:Apolipoprotein L3-like n=2 Tax=Castor canadensis TaxID=51338 RepID=A0A8C0ZR60_CASCN
MSVGVRNYLWIFYSVPLVFVSGCVPLPFWNSDISRIVLFADELRQALKKLTADMTEEEKEKIQKDLQEVKRFWDEFPQVKTEVEQHIRKLCDLAEEVDRVHRGCTISNVVASSTGAASGLMTILGFALALVTAGTSLVLSAGGMALGAVSTATGITSTIVEEANRSSVHDEAHRLLSVSIDILNKFKRIMLKCVPKVLFGLVDLKTSLKGLGRNVCAIKEARLNPQLLREARSLMTTGRTSAQSAERVQRALRGTALTMTRGARIRGGIFAGITLGMDVYSLVQDSKHLSEGAEAELAKELRQVAQELEKKLKELVQIQDTLQSDPTQLQLPSL